MLSRSNSVLWMQQDESESSHQNNNNNNNGANHNQQQLVVDPTARVEAVNDMANSLSSFKSMLDVDDDGDHNWFLPHTTHHHQNNQLTFSTNHQVHHHNRNNLGLLQQVLPVDSCNSSCSPSSASVFNNNNNNNPLLDPSQVHYFLPPKPSLHSILNPLDPSSSFDLGGILTGFNDLTSSQTHLGSPNLTHPDPHLSHFSTTHLLQLPTTTTNAGNGFGSPGFPGFEEGSGTSSLFLNRSKLLKPLDNFASIGAQPTLFQKRAALRKNLTHEPNTCNFGGELAANDKKRKSSTGSWDDMDNLSFDGSGMGYDSDDFTENNITNSKFDQESVKNGGTSSNPNSTITGGVGDQKGGKKKGLPAKNLMAERRRRKKLNDRLYMLRSVVPKISKMDRASILGDAIEYLKELLQKINDLHNELEATPASSSLTPTTGFYPLTPTPPTLPGRIKEELCPSSLPSPTGQPARVEVRLREGRAVNIHMFCNRRPGLLLSTMKALDNLGLDIQQAVISCFNGFALDIFRAEQCKEGQDVHPDQIKAVLLDSAGFHGMV